MAQPIAIILAAGGSRRMGSPKSALRLPNGHPNLAGDWAVRVISQVGNYGEIFEKNLGKNTPLGIARGVNAQWKKGGLMYAPPFR